MAVLDENGLPVVARVRAYSYPNRREIREQVSRFLTPWITWAKNKKETLKMQGEFLIKEAQRLKGQLGRMEHSTAVAFLDKQKKFNVILARYWNGFIQALLGRGIMGGTKKLGHGLMRWKKGNWRFVYKNLGGRRYCIVEFTRRQTSTYSDPYLKRLAQRCSS
jgi:hypothetical protein